MIQKHFCFRKLVSHLIILENSTKETQSVHTKLSLQTEGFFYKPLFLVLDGIITATASYAENLGSSINPIALYSFYILICIIALFFLPLCKYVIIIVSYYLNFGSL